MANYEMKGFKDPETIEKDEAFERGGWRQPPFFLKYF
jgi:hypothetical protein